MLMKHISRKDKVWHEKMIDVEKVYWKDLKEDDLVFIPGNLIDNEPTAMYGRHIIVSVEQQQLVNAVGRKFYERFDYLFMETKGPETYMGRLSKHGNWIVDDFKMMSDRYFYDRKFLIEKNWYTISLDQDAEYFGVWVNDVTYQILTYCEGDITLVESLNYVQHNKEYREMITFYEEA